MLFSMVERGMSGEVVGDKGKLRAAAAPTTDRDSHNTDEAMWAVILTKELWRKGVWLVPSSFFVCQMLNHNCRSDAKSVSIIAQGCFHPTTKVQSASLHFFLGSEEVDEDSEDEVRSS